MIQITRWLPTNSSVLTANGAINALEWLIIEAQRINTNTNRHIEIEQTSIACRLIDRCKVKRLRDGLLVYGGD